MGAPRIAIVAAEFNHDLVNAMIAAAQKQVAEERATLLRVIRVPGTYEVPLLVDSQLAEQDVDALVVLGFIERGETLHGEVMGHVVHKTLIDLQLKYKKPVGIGIIGPGASAEQADVRKEAYARAAVRAAVRSFQVLNGSPGAPGL